MSALVPEKTCAECRLPMFDVGEMTHPNCDPRREAGERYAVSIIGVRQGLALRDEGIARTSGAHPEELAIAAQIIRDAAARVPDLSANTVRAQMMEHRIPGSVIGAAFQKVRSEGVIAARGYRRSDQPETHGHPVQEYSSRIYRVAS